MFMRSAARARAAAGLMEITKLHERCLADRELRAATRQGEWLIALHSSLSSAEQQSVFERPPEGARPLSADAALHMQHRAVAPRQHATQLAQDASVKAVDCCGSAPARRAAGPACALGCTMHGW